MAISPQQTRKRATKPTAEPAPANPIRSAGKGKAPGMHEVFTSTAMKLMVLMLIMLFNVVVLKNSFLLAAPTQGFSGNLQIDAVLYGIALSVMMVIILFHEENWDNIWCPGAIALYLNTLILILYTRWFEFFLGVWMTKWLLSGLLIFLPVMGLFIMVVMLKK
jgi:hypothetical protein